MQKQPEDSRSKWSRDGARLNGVADSTYSWRNFRGSGQSRSAPTTTAISARRPAFAQQFSLLVFGNPCCCCVSLRTAGRRFDRAADRVRSPGRSCSYPWRDGMAHSFDAVLNGRTVKFRVQVISTFLIVLYLFNLHPMAICPLILSYTGHLPGDFHVGQTPEQLAWTS